MSTRDPRRLLDYGDALNGVIRGALDAERADADADVDAERLARIQAKLATAAEAASAPSAAPAPPSADPAPPSPAPAPPSPTAAAPTVSKLAWLLVASAALVGAGAIALSLGDGGAPAPGELAPRIVASDVESPGVASAAPAPPGPPSIAVEELPSVGEPKVAKPATRTSPPSAVEPAVKGDGEEIALLARAHEALHGHPAQSLALCDEHQARFSGGAFAQEREAVAIEALVYLNRKTEAERRWTDFRERYPTSSHRVHLESLFSGAASPRR